MYDSRLMPLEYSAYSQWCLIKNDTLDGFNTWPQGIV